MWRCLAETCPFIYVTILPESFEEASWDSDGRWSQKNHTSLHSTAGHRVLVHSSNFLWLYLDSSSSLLSPVSTFIIRIFTDSWSVWPLESGNGRVEPSFPPGSKPCASYEALMHIWFMQKEGWEEPVTGRRARAPSQGQCVHMASTASLLVGHWRHQGEKLDWFFFYFILPLYTRCWIVKTQRRI